MSVALDRVTIRYGDRVAVQDVSVDFPPGACGLLGRNGAGKSSILKALLGLVRPSSGSMRILDLPADLSGAAQRQWIGYMPERDAHIPQCTGFEMVALLGRLSGMPSRDAFRRAHEVLYLVGLEDQRYRQVSTFSAGMRQKVKLASALVHDPPVLFLDEPTNGLDPGGRAEMLKLIRTLCTEFGKSVVLSTHILQDVEDVCGNAVVLEQGRVIARGTIGDLTRAAGRRLRFAIDPAATVLPAAIGSSTTVEALGDGDFLAQLGAVDSAAAVFSAVAAAGARVRRLVVDRPSLGEVFLGLVASGSRSPSSLPQGLEGDRG